MGHEILTQGRAPPPGPGEGRKPVSKEGKRGGGGAGLGQVTKGVGAPPFLGGGWDLSALNNVPHEETG